MGDAEQLLQQLIKLPTLLLWIRPPSRLKTALADSIQQAVLHQVHNKRYFVIDTAAKDKFWDMDPIKKVETILDSSW